MASKTVDTPAAVETGIAVSSPIIEQKPAPKKDVKHPPRYAGFVAGVFSGITKLAVGHPFDTIKVRMQTSPDGQFKGPMDCLLKTIRNEGVRGLYKGATPPLVGWMVMDSVMLGSLHNYRRCIKDWAYPGHCELPFVGKCIAGILSGWTVSFVAAPIEHVKARLQVQYDAATTRFTGPLAPVHLATDLVKNHGFFQGLYKGLFATMIFRTNFLFWWGSYDIFNNYFEKQTNMNKVVANFWAGGLSATVFWITAYPVDVVKQRIMTDDLDNPRYKSWLDAFKNVYRTYGWKGYFRGFGPSILRSFPANASALASFELVMRMFHVEEEGQKLE